jgi:hypothetical protein
LPVPITLNAVLEKDSYNKKIYWEINDPWQEKALLLPKGGKLREEVTNEK